MTRTVPPVVLDPYDYRFQDDPYPTYAALRQRAPLYRNEDLGFWALSRHADVAEALRDAERFSSADGVSLDPGATGRHAEQVMSFLAMDDPKHFRLRRIVSKGFTPRRVRDLEERVRDITVAHLRAALARDAFDFVEELAGRVPMDVVSELLGVPPADRAELRRLADLQVHREDGVADIPAEAVAASLALIDYYLELVHARRRVREGDLVSVLVDVEVDGDRLTDDELTGILFLLVVAGNETTTKLLGNAWFWGARHRDQVASVFAGEVPVQRWVDETLRFDASSQILARTAAQDVPLHGGVIPAGDRVLLLLGSANRDELVFAHPDRFDLLRDTSALLSFGAGPHFCMGASLARLEARVVLEELVGLVRGYDVDEAGARRVQSVSVRGFAHLPTTVTRR